MKNELGHYFELINRTGQIDRCSYCGCWAVLQMVEYGENHKDVYFYGELFGNTWTFEKLNCNEVILRSVL
jgi:hypothetical protein